MSCKDHWGRFMRFRSFLSAAALAASVVGVGSASAAVIINGDFEAVQIGSPFSSNDPANIPGWVHGGAQGDFLLWNNNGSDSGGTFHAGQGHQFVTMGGGFENPPASSSWTNTISGLTIGQAYALQFMIAYEANFFQFNTCTGPFSCVPITPVPQTVHVSLFGGPSGDFTTGTNGPAYWGTWQNESLSFVATGTSQDVTFSAITSFDVGLDNVQISAVPELSTWAMMMLGFAGIGLVAYRRNKKAALAA